MDFSRLSERHLYGALFAGAALSFCLRHFTGRFPLLSDFLAIAGYATCGWSWLVTRALFQKPDAPRRLWPLLLVLAMTGAGAFLHVNDDPAQTLPRMIGNMETLVSSTLMLFALIQPLSGSYRDLPAGERRFRLIYVGVYLADLTIGLIAVRGAPAGSITARWADPIQMSCALASVLGMAAAVLYRDRHPVPVPEPRVKQRAISAEESALGERLLRLMTEETAYAAPELKVADLAHRLGEAEYKVTQCITGALGFRNFNQMINRFRIEEAKRRLADPKCDHLPILTIALDCGFGSIGPFNRAFKAEMAVTPMAFRKGRHTTAPHLLAALLCCLIPAAAGAVEYPLPPIEIGVGVQQRSLRLFVPDGLKPGAPLLLLFHGAGDSGAGFRRGTGHEFERLAIEHGFAVVYLDGYKGNWNDCRRADPFPARTENIDDIAFVEAVIHLAEERLGSDPHRVLAVGFSNGASMVYRLALERPELVAAIAAISGNLPAKDNMICREAGKPVAAMILSGTEDPLVPYTGGDVTIFGMNSRGRVVSAEESAAYFVRLDGLREAPREDVWPIRVEDGTRIQLRDWAAPGKPPVELMTVVGGGHVVPQTEFRFPAILGKQSANLDAPPAIWDFFERALAAR